MIRYGGLYNAHQRARFMRPDAARYVRPDVSRWLTPPHPDEQKYSPSQPRDWRGRWANSIGALAKPFGSLSIQSAQEQAEQETNSGGILAFSEESQAATMFDIDPDIVGNAGDELAQNRNSRSGNSVTINGQQFELTPAQGARLSAAQAGAEAAIARVVEIEPNWRPPSSAYQSPEGLIRAYQGDAAAAQARATELAGRGLLSGPFSGDSIPARGPGRDFTSAERREINRIGSDTGCHTCGTRDPGTISGNFVVDHQIPSALNLNGRAQRLFPHCLTCSLTQGGWVNSIRGRR